MAALGWEFLRGQTGNRLDGITFSPMETILPGLTCPVQASFRTGEYPSVHGMVANGLFDRTRRRAAFWEQSAGLVAGPRIWDKFRAGGRRVAMLFWQQSMGEAVDIVLSPAPIHKHHGGMIQDCYGKPDSLYKELCRRIGRPFSLMHYWGPMASGRSSSWIARATCEVLAGCPESPDLCLTYLPVLDYDLQRYGPDHPKSRKTFQELWAQLNMLRQACDRHGFEFLAYGDYAIEPCRGGAVFPNRVLREKGWLSMRNVAGGGLYPDLYDSRAFAMVDHQIAHVYIPDASDIERVRDDLRHIRGVGAVLEPKELDAGRLACANSGELVVLASPGHWLAYPWWDQAGDEPDYARHVDIHNKPGYDPCELFWGWPPGSVSRDVNRIGGSHGLVGAGRDACWASSFMKAESLSLIELAGQTRQWLETNV
ncbi:MAG: nucleotide pyrophosphatase/phosphodiesterase family protein [bacterium]